jgi:hypothetical protein
MSCTGAAPLRPKSARSHLITNLIFLPRSVFPLFRYFWFFSHSNKDATHRLFVSGKLRLLSLFAIYFPANVSPSTVSGRKITPSP